MHVHSPAPPPAVRRAPARRALAVTVALSTAALALVATAPASQAAVTSVVNPATTSWASADTRPGGTYAFTDEFGAPEGFGDSSLRIETSTPTAKVQYFTAQDAGLPLVDIESVSYSSYRSSASTGQQLQIPSVNVYLDPDGPGGPLDFAPMIFEPYYTYGTTTNDEWRTWDGATPEALWWSTRQVGTICPNNCYVPLSTFKEQAPDATVTAYGFNQGSGNPGIIAAVDALTINDKTFDFEALDGGIVVDDDGKGTAADCDADVDAFATIAAAVAYATAGDTVEVCAGTYPETLTVTKQLTFLGAQAGNDARVGRETADPSTESIIRGSLIANGVSGTTIDGFWFTGTATNVSIGLYNGTSGHTVLNNVIADNDETAVEAAIIYTSDGTAPSLFAQNRVTGGDQHGFFATPNAVDTVIRDNAFADNGSSVVHFASNPATPSSDVVVSGNTSTDDANFIVGEDVNNLTVTGNVVDGVGFTGMLFGGGFVGALIEGNVITGTSTAISISSQFSAVPNSGFVIRENDLTGNTTRGINLAAGSYSGIAEVHLNRIVDNGPVANRSGIRNQSSGAVNAENNWWGCNEGPGGVDCDGESGFVDPNPRLVLSTIVLPDPVSATTTVTADLTKNSAGVDLSATGTVPAIPVTFEASVGELASTTGTLVDGKATTTLSRAGATGAATASATVDHETSTDTFTFVAPKVSIADATVGEGVGDAVVTISIDLTNDQDVTFSYETATGTAGAADFTATSGTGIIPAGQTSAVIEVPITQDAADETDESFTVTLTAASLEITTATATVTITDDDDAPTVSVGNVKVKEGNKASFVVSLSAPSFLETSVDVTTQNGTAKAPGDFAPVTRSIIFAPGETEATVKVQTNADDINEPKETFKLLLSGPDGLTLGDKTGVATIKKNKSAPGLLAGTGV